MLTSGAGLADDGGGDEVGFYRGGRGRCGYGGWGWDILDFLISVAAFVNLCFVSLRKGQLRWLRYQLRGNYLRS